jgi:hypothetical protein
MATIIRQNGRERAATRSYTGAYLARTLAPAPPEEEKRRA